MNKRLQKIVRSNNFNPDRLIEFLQPDVDGRFEADAGVWEKYTISEHTFMMMRQFERYFDHNSLPDCLSREEFRLMLALHDIGKPDAIAQGDKNMQHKYTLKIMQELFEKYNIAKIQANIMYALINTDALGSYIRDRLSLEDTIKQIRESSATIKISVIDFFRILSIFYRCDAGSYTVNAGGFESLDHLFIFDREKPKLAFAPDILMKVQKLQEAL